jgi:hypothetical protein
VGESEGRITTYSNRHVISQDKADDQKRQAELIDDLPMLELWSRTSTGKRRKRADPASDRKKFILTLKGLTELEYCQKMHDAGYVTPPTWQQWGCPADYMDAFNLKKRLLRNRFLDAIRHTEKRNAKRK